MNIRGECLKKSSHSIASQQILVFVFHTKNVKPGRERNNQNYNSSNLQNRTFPSEKSFMALFVNDFERILLANLDSRSIKSEINTLRTNIVKLVNRMHNREKNYFDYDSFIGRIMHL